MDERDAGARQLFRSKVVEGFGPNRSRRNLILGLAALAGLILIMPRRNAWMDLSGVVVFLAAVAAIEFARALRRGEGLTVAVISAGGLLVAPLVFFGVIALTAAVVAPANESPLAIVLAGIGAIVIGAVTWLAIWRQITAT